MSPSADEVALAEEQIRSEQKKIEYYVSDWTIEVLVGKLNKGELTIPTYQRAFTWELERQSRFVESVLINLPIPFLFFWEDPDTGNMEIVDGSQRLRTLQSFLAGELALGELEKLTHAEGLTFNDFPESRKRKILNRPIRGILLSEDTDAFARLDLFDRINTGSKAANKAEIRRGVLSGPFMALVSELAVDPKFISLAPLSKKSVDERGHEELVTRFFAYSDGLDDYHDLVGEFLFNYTKKMNAKAVNDPDLVNVYRTRFLKMLDRVESIFEFGFKKTERASTTARSRYEALAIGTYLAYNENPLLEPDVDEVNRVVGLSEFARIVGSDGANARKKLVRRIAFVKNLLLGEAE